MACGKVDRMTRDGLELNPADVYGQERRRRGDWWTLGGGMNNKPWLKVVEGQEVKVESVSSLRPSISLSRVHNSHKRVATRKTKLVENVH
jgi:hypothetical protein